MKSRLIIYNVGIFFGYVMSSYPVGTSLWIASTIAGAMTVSIVDQLIEKWNAAKAKPVTKEEGAVEYKCSPCGGTGFVVAYLNGKRLQGSRTCLYCKGSGWKPIKGERA